MWNAKGHKGTSRSRNDIIYNCPSLCFVGYYAGKSAVSSIAALTLLSNLQYSIAESCVHKWSDMREFDKDRDVIGILPPREQRRGVIDRSQREAIMKRAEVD